MIAWSEELALDYLSNSMFREDLKKDKAKAEETIHEITYLLTSQDLTKSHSRPIPPSICQESGLKVDYMEDDQNLQDIILSIHHASTLSIMNTSTVKIIENQNGQSYISKYSESPNFPREKRSL